MWSECRDIRDVYSNFSVRQPTHYRTEPTSYQLNLFSSLLIEIRRNSFNSSQISSIKKNICFDQNGPKATNFRVSICILERTTVLCGLHKWKLIIYLFIFLKRTVIVLCLWLCHQPQRVQQAFIKWPFKQRWQCLVPLNALSDHV